MWTSEYTSYEPDSYDDLSHFGIRGMKWGHRIRDRYRKSIENRSLIYQKRDGLSKEKADKKAKRVVNTKIGLTIGAITLGAVLAYNHANRIHDTNIDHIIDPNTRLNRIIYDEYRERPTKVFDSRFRDSVYASTGSKDNKRYLGLFAGGQKKSLMDYGYNMHWNPDKPLKIAGRDTISKTVRELGLGDKNNSFINRKKADKINIYAINPLYEDATKLKNALKNKGYDGMVDVNDRLYSGYNTTANILFEHKYNNFTTERLLDHKDEINKIARSEKLKVWGQMLAPVAVGGTLVGGLVNSHLVKEDSDKIRKETGGD